MQYIVSCSVVIPTRNRLVDICAMLRTIHAQTVIPAEIIIIDSSDELLIANEEFKAIFSRDIFIHTTLVYEHTPLRGITVQRNRGIRLVTQPITHFMDDDMLLAPDYLERMHEVFDAYSYYAGGMGTLSVSVPQKSFNGLLRRIFLLQRIYASGHFTPSGMPTHPYGRKDFLDVTVLNGCASYRTYVFKEYQCDESLGVYAYMEDCDLSKRVSSQYRLFFNPQAHLDHTISTHNRLDIVENRAVFIRNYTYLFFKNFYPERKIRICAYAWSILGLFLEALIARNKKYCVGYVRGLWRYMRE
jgi:glycosyltransferase involved in cell wall biosynthesis